MNTPLRLGNKLDMEIKANVHNDIAHQKKEKKRDVWFNITYSFMEMHGFLKKGAKHLL